MPPSTLQNRHHLQEPAVSHLNEELDKCLLAYVAVATAAGVGILSLAQPAEGKIIYTPTHKTVRLNRAVPIDLNPDGIHDFDVFNKTHNSTTPFGSYLKAEPLRSGNEIWAQQTSRGFYGSALALRAGARVGSSVQKFAAGREMMAYRSSGSSTRSGGRWKNVSKRYLGLKFLINGKVHYGWARLNVAISKQISTTLTGYAYETVPNKSIVTGDTGSEATLGVLARGR